jgi:hypothetical protein
MDIACGLEPRHKECVHNFGWETFWKLPTWRAEKEMQDNSNMDASEKNCEHYG